MPPLVQRPLQETQTKVEGRAKKKPQVKRIIQTINTLRDLMSLCSILSTSSSGQTWLHSAHNACSALSDSDELCCKSRI